MTNDGSDDAEVKALAYLRPFTVGFVDHLGAHDDVRNFSVGITVTRTCFPISITKQPNKMRNEARVTAFGFQRSLPGLRGFPRTDPQIAFVQGLRCRRPHRRVHHRGNLREHAGMAPSGLGDALSYR